MCPSAALAASLLAGPAYGWQCADASVVRVHDGDTVSMRCADGAPVKLRLAGIDAPELHQDYGPEAREALARLLHDTPVRVVSRAVDRYARLVADVTTRDGDAGLALVAEGLAWCGLRPSASCRAALDAAREAHRGLWVEREPLPPWQWRRQHPRTD